MSAPIPQASATADPSRVASVDALRGLIITLMVFVNDVAGARHAPSWLQHVGIDADAMTLPDIVFPAFLFIAGVSIPLALGRALAQGRSRAELLGRVLARTGALLVMGVVMVNGDAHDPWPRDLWKFLAYTAMFLAFAVVPEQPGRARTVLRAGRRIGSAALLVLALAHRDAEGRMLVLGPLFHEGDTVWLRHSWWGILGLIAWAYAVAAVVYLFLGHRREWLVGAAGLLTLLYLTAQADLPAHLAGRPWLAWAAPLLAPFHAVLGWIDGHVSLGTMLGSHAGLTMAGACLGSILAGGSEIATPGARVRWGLTFAAGLFLAGLLLDAPHGINKIRGTPAWCLYCAAITTALWVVLYWLMDIRGVRAWSRLLGPAGANPLFAYLLHPFLIFVIALGGEGLRSLVFFYRSLPALPAALGSLLMALLVVQLTGWIARAGFRLKV